MLRRKCFAFAVITVVAGIALWLFFPRAYEVDISTEFLEWQNNNSSHLVSRKVNICGSYRKCTVGKDTFVGSLEIEGTDGNIEISPMYLKFELPSLGGGHISPIVLHDGNSKINTDGWLFVCSSDFSHVSILLPDFYSGGATSNLPETNSVIWAQSESIVLSYPAANREQAVALTQKLCEGTRFSSGWN